MINNSNHTMEYIIPTIPHNPWLEKQIREWLIKESERVFRELLGEPQLPTAFGAPPYKHPFDFTGA